MGNSRGNKFLFRLAKYSIKLTSFCTSLSPEEFLGRNASEEYWG